MRVTPHVFYGDREEEIAYTQLYGHFALTFYEGYRSVYPLQDGYAERKDLYCLYHLLVRQIEGALQAGPQIDRLLHRYLGYRSCVYTGGRIEGLAGTETMPYAFELSSLGE